MANTYYAGEKLRILYSADFEKSLAEVIAIHHKNNDKDLAKGDRLIKMLGDCGRLRSPDQFRQESQGFFAIRAGSMRFYGWYEPDSVFVISHVIFKAVDKLAQADIDRMNRNKTNYQKTIKGKNR